MIQDTKNTLSKIYPRRGFYTFLDEQTPGIVYWIAANSVDNQKRKLEYRGDRIVVGPIGEPTQAQLADADNIFYTAVRLFKGGKYNKNNFLLVSN